MNHHCHAAVFWHNLDLACRADIHPLDDPNTISVVLPANQSKHDGVRELLWKESKTPVREPAFLWTGTEHYQLKRGFENHVPDLSLSLSLSVSLSLSLSLSLSESPRICGGKNPESSLLSFSLLISEDFCFFLILPVIV